MRTRPITHTTKQPYLKHHNPRTFEDLAKPVPNFKKFGLKAGEVPKFFDNVLAARAADAVAAKDAWWATRRAAAAEAVKEMPAKAVAPLPVPKWEAPDKPVPLAALKASTDALFKQMEPKRKLAAPGASTPVSISLCLLSPPCCCALPRGWRVAPASHSCF